MGKVICTGNNWLKEQDEQFFNNSIRALDKRWTKCISVARDYVESAKIWCTYLVINHVRLRTF